MRRRFSETQRRILAWVSGGKCCRCEGQLDDQFHADHIVPFAQGGATTLRNGQALCRPCNLQKGAKVIRLRPWQKSALDKALHWLLVEKTDRHFLINAAPGAGKTIAACVIAQELFERGEIERVIIIAPRSEVVNQWSSDFHRVTGRYMSKVTARDGDIAALQMDVCATWIALQGLQDALQAVCQSSKTLVICDEHHHAAVEAAWGDGADSAFASARYVVVLTGTPIRSDGERSVWLAYDDAGAINHPEGGTYTLTYGEAVDLGYCRPVTFHRHEGHFTVDLDGGEAVSVSSREQPKLTQKLARIPGLQRALNFYRLACTPQFEADKHTPLANGYQATMVDYAAEKLTELRHRMPNAGGLVIAPSIEMADYFVRLITAIEGEAPLLVHSQLPNADAKIKAFKNTDRRWLVSVAMVSEGVDIPRLRVLVYLPHATTELSFRQAIGRVVRTSGHDDDTRAYVVMPSFETFEMYARRIEEEMAPSVRFAQMIPKTKRCPSCAHECELGAKTCPSCEHEFPVRSARLKSCAECGALNSAGASSCVQCNHPMGPVFTLTLDDALRTGAIVRGMDIDETEVQEAEKMAPKVRERVLRSGDQNLVKVLRVLPDETWARLHQILSETSC